MPKYSFYRPHERLQFKNELTNPHTGEVTTPPSMTKQEFKRECDINNVIKQYSVTGQLNHINAKAKIGAYQDLPDSYDFQESLDIIKQGEEAFMSLPAKTRDRFNNEPAEFLAFMDDPKNKAEAIKLGLVIAPPPVPTAPPPTPTVPTGGETGGTPPPSNGSESPKT